MAVNRDWQKVLVPKMAREFFDKGEVSLEFLREVFKVDGAIQASDKQALKKYRDWTKAQVLTGKVCLVGGKHGPTATKKALTAREGKSAVLSLEALESAIIAAGGSVDDEDNRGRKPQALDFDFLDDVEDDSEV